MSKEMSDTERYYWNREELKLLHSRQEVIGRVYAGQKEPSDLTCLLIQMVDKLFGQVATLQHELTKHIGDDGCERCPHGEALESYDACPKCEAEEAAKNSVET